MALWRASDLEKMRLLDPKLVRLAHLIYGEVCGIAIMVSHREEDAQNLAFSTGKSKVKWPNSKHNSIPSKAMDIVPTPVNLNGKSLREELTFIAGAVRIIAAREGYKVRWGGDWDKDGDLEDNNFDDLFHFELTE